MIPDDLLARSLEEIRQGKGSLEAILTRLPYDTRVELEPLLRLALQVERLRNDAATAPADAFRAALRSQLMSATVETAPAVYRNGHTPHAPAFDNAPAPAKVTPLPARRTLFPRRWQQLAASFAAGALMLAGAGVGGAQAARDSLPDQPLLYSLKLAQEKVRLTLASTEDERVGVYLQIANTRLQELSRATDAGKTDLAYHLSQKYTQTLTETTSALQNNGPEKNAITNTEVAGFVAQQVTSLQALQKKAPDGVREAVAIALSAASRVQGDLTVAVSPASAEVATPPAPDASTTAVVSDPPPPLPSATITVPEPSPAPAPSHGVNITGGASGGSGPSRGEAVPAPSGSLVPPADKSGDASGATSPEKGLSGAAPAPQPIPPRSADAPSAPAPVTAQPGSEPQPAPSGTPESAPAPAETPSGSDSGSGPAPAPAQPADKPPVISTPPDAAATPVPTPADGKGSGGLTPAPTPTPSKGLTTPDSGGNKDRILPSVRPSFEVEVSAQPQAGAPITITAAFIAPEDRAGIQ